MEVHPYLTTRGFIDQLNFTQEQIEKEGFLDGGVWFTDTKTIICGTFPPKTEYFDRKGYLHYSSNRNKFWSHNDANYNTKLNIITDDNNLRIQNSFSKIKFCKLKQVGFIDIFTKVDRANEKSAKDSGLKPIGTIFEDGIFDNILNSNVQQIAFVYKLAEKVFLKYIKDKYDLQPIIIRKYNTNGITLEVKRILINGRMIYLSYSPIHGRIEDYRRQPALKKVIDFDIL